MLFNAGLIFFTFAVSIPGLILPNNRTWLNIHGWLLIACGITTLVLGLDIWFSTLQTRSNVGVLWSHQSSQDRSMLQQKVCSIDPQNPHRSSNLTNSTVPMLRLPHLTIRTRPHMSQRRRGRKTTRLRRPVQQFRQYIPRPGVYIPVRPRR